MYATTVYNVTSCNCKRKCNCKKNIETFENACPNLLVKSNNNLLLFNTNEPNGPNNPLPFFNLDEYINYLEVQKSKGIDCPVLFLQEEVNTQGENVFRIRPSLFDMQGGLPTTPNIIENGNSNDYFVEFDAHGQNIGKYTTVDAVHDSTSSKKISDNPMDKNWAGITYTQQMIDSGKYINNEITKPSVLVNV